MNKMFKKIFAVVAACATVATMSISAFAADVTVAPTDGAVTVTPTAVEANMYTVMVFSCAADANKDTAVPADASAIYYINQGTDLAALTANMLVKATSETEYLPVGNYIVRVGNDTGSVENFTLESKVTSTGIEITLNVGDINGDGAADSTDAGLILQKGVGLVAKFTDQQGREIPELAGDVNGDGATDSTDAGLILQKGVGLIAKFTDQNGNELTTYKYTYVAPTE